MQLQREYYTLEEAAELLENYSLQDIHHFIETEKLMPVLYSGKRRYIAVSFDKNKREWVGHAVCSYRGLLRVHQSWITSLWDKGEIVLNAASTPMARDVISQWDSVYPYKGSKPKAGFSAWKGCSEKDVIDKLLLVPFAIESDSRLSFFSAIAKGMGVAGTAVTPKLKRQGFTLVDGEVQIPESYRFSYSFTENGAFSRNALRLTADTITNLNTPSAKPGLLSQPKSALEELDKILPWSNSKKGGDLINEVVERFYRKYPDVQTGQLWRLMQKYYGGDCLDSVVEEITPNEICWISRKAEQKITTYGAFEKKLSAVRVFYRNNGIPIPK